jgi:hypothetical protein
MVEKFFNYKKLFIREKITDFERVKLKLIKGQKIIFLFTIDNKN